MTVGGEALNARRSAFGYPLENMPRSEEPEIGPGDEIVFAPYTAGREGDDRGEESSDEDPVTLSDSSLPDFDLESASSPAPTIHALDSALAPSSSPSTILIELVDDEHARHNESKPVPEPELSSDVQNEDVSESGLAYLRLSGASLEADTELNTTMNAEIPGSENEAETTRDRSSVDCGYDSAEHVTDDVITLGLGMDMCVGSVPELKLETDNAILDDSEGHVCSGQRNIGVSVGDDFTGTFQRGGGDGKFTAEDAMSRKELEPAGTVAASERSDGEQACAARNEVGQVMPMKEAFSDFGDKTARGAAVPRDVISVDLPYGGVSKNSLGRDAGACLGSLPSDVDVDADVEVESEGKVEEEEGGEEDDAYSPSPSHLHLHSPSPSFSPYLHSGSAPIAIGIPTRASAIPRHVRRALALSTPGSSPSPTPSLNPSPLSSVEDFGVVLSISPGHFAYAAANADRTSVRLRPDSPAIDPGLPHPRLRTRTPFPSLEQSPLSLLPSPLPDEERDDQRVETETDRDFDFDFGPDAERAQIATEDATYALPEFGSADTFLTVSTNEREAEEEREPSSVFLDSESFVDINHELIIDTDRDVYTFATTASGDSTTQPPFSPTEYLDSDAEDDSSMLPPLSTLPEEDPVFSLSPVRARSRVDAYNYGDYPGADGHSAAISRKASTATNVSSGSARSNKSSYKNDAFFGMNHSVSNLGSGSGSASGSSAWTHARNASSSSGLSLRSHASFDSRYAHDGHGRGRRQGSQSSGMSLLSSTSSLRTKYDPAPSTEELSLGLREYAGNPHATAARAEIEVEEGVEIGTRVSRREVRGFRDDELELGHADIGMPRDCDALLSGWHPFDADDAAGGFEPGSSSGTVRPGHAKAASVSAAMMGRVHSGGYAGSRSAAGGAGQDWGSRAAGGGGAGYGSQRSYGRERAGNGSSGSDYGNGRGVPGGGHRDRGRDDGRDDRNGSRSRKASVSSPSTTSSESESESESESDDYGQDLGSPSVATAFKTPAQSVPPSPSPAQDESSAPVFSQLRNGRKGVFRPPPGAYAGNVSVVSNDSGNRTLPQSASTEDDNVPLAQRIPGALRAQKSIRQQVHDERAKRRRDRSVAPGTSSRVHEGTVSPPPVPQQQFVEHLDRGRTNTVKPPKGAALGPGPSTAMSSSQEAAMLAQRTLQPLRIHQPPPATRRPRAKTIGEAGAGGVVAEDLTQRLLRVQARVGPDANTSLPVRQTSGTSPSRQQRPRDAEETLLSAGESAGAGAGAYNAMLLERGSAPPTAALPRRSHQSPHSPPIGAQSFQQHQIPGVSAEAPVRTLRPMRSFHGQVPATVSSSAVPAPPLPLPSGSLGRRPTSSRGRASQDMNVGVVKSARASIDKTTRTSADYQQQQQQQQLQQLQQQQQQQQQSHPLPPLQPLQVPVSPVRVPFGPSSASSVVQTRVYIGDMQRFNVVEAGPETNAKDMLDMLAQQGDLRGEERRSGNWMLYEVCHDFGMERPIRSFELVTDISGSWSKEKTMNCFMVKRLSFALSLANIPSSIPTRSGFVDYESKKGKWNKRWLELREHGLWLSKREGKDEEFLCSLSAFDAYIVTRIHKAPKPFAFSVKSTDPIKLFENKSDYLHVFSCPDDTGRQWVESIMLARSYILYQEKHVLFRNRSMSTGQPAGASTGGGAALSRAGTRKRPTQTYVTLATPGPGAGTAQVTGPFEPGSLLAKRAAA